MFCALNHTVEGDSKERLYISDVSGRRLRLLQSARTDNRAAFSQPVFTPDGRGILYTQHGSEAPTGSLHLFSLSTQRAKRIAGYGHTKSTYDCMGAQYSPDGKTIASTTAGPLKGLVGGRVDNGGILLMNANGTVQRLQLQGNYTDPSWSPSGGQLAIDTDQGLAIVDIKTRRVRTIIRNPKANSPAWQPLSKPD